MRENIRKIIKKEVVDIIESGHKQDDINNHSKELAELIVSFLGNYIKNNKYVLFWWIVVYDFVFFSVFSHFS